MPKRSVIDKYKVATKIVSQFAELVEKSGRFECQRRSGSDLIVYFDDNYWFRLKQAQITLYGPPLFTTNRLLEITTVSRKQTGKNASRIFRESGTDWLAHSGRVTTNDGRPKPTSLEVVELDGNPYNLVGSFSSDDLLDKIIVYHESRTSEKRSFSGEKFGSFDHGPNAGYLRSSATVVARHSPICHDFVSWLGLKENDAISANSVVPDIYVRIGNKNTIFEIKPDAGLHNLTTAVGQLLVYGEACGAERLVIVAPKPDPKRPWYKHFMNLISDQKIGYVCVEKSKSGIFKYSMHPSASKGLKGLEKWLN